MNRKFELTDITMKFKGRTLYRIRALKDFRDVEAGDLGGWIQSENNLSQKGDCWVYDEAKCMDYAKIYDNSTMHNNSVMCDFSEIHDNSRMYGDSELNNSAKLYGKLVSKVDNFIEMQNPKGRLVTCVKKGDKILYNIGWQDEIDEQTFKYRIENEDGGLEKHPHRKFYYKIIGMSKLYFNVKYIRIIKLILDKCISMMYYNNCKR